MDYGPIYRGLKSSRRVPCIQKPSTVSKYRAPRRIFRWALHKKKVVKPVWARVRIRGIAQRSTRMLPLGPLSGLSQLRGNLANLATVLHPCTFLNKKE